MPDETTTRTKTKTKPDVQAAVRDAIAAAVAEKKEAPTVPKRLPVRRIVR